jgi:hypothetical protein
MSWTYTVSSATTGVAVNEPDESGGSIATAWRQIGRSDVTVSLSIELEDAVLVDPRS